MKKIKRIQLMICLALVIFCTFTFTSCSFNQATVTSVEKVFSENGESLYKITYSDGTESVVEVKDGGKKVVESTITVDDLYDKYIELNPDGTFEDFAKNYLTVATDNSTVINKTVASSIKIYAEFTEKTSVFPYGGVQMNKAVISGSGVVFKIDADYVYFITNYHVLYNKNATTKISDTIHCYVYGSEGSPVDSKKKDLNGLPVYDYGDYAIECEYVGGSIATDIAIIKAKISDVLLINDKVRAIEFADGYYIGETAIAIGNSEDEGISVTEGIVSVDNEYIKLQIDSQSRSYRALRIDTAIYSGNSGGGLFNKEGKLIGITNAGDQEDQNVNFAIPVDIVKSVVDSIMYYSAQGTVAKKAVIGVTVNSVNSKYVYDASVGYGRIIEEVIVTSVTKDGVVNSLGVGVGDEIVSVIVNSKEKVIDRYFEIGDLLYTVKSGDTIKFTIKHNGEIKETSVYEIKESDLEDVS